MNILVRVAIVGQNRAVKAGDIAWVFPLKGEPVLIKAPFSEDEVEGGNIPVQIHLCGGKFNTNDWVWNSSQNKVFQATEQTCEAQHEADFLLKILASTNADLNLPHISIKSQFVRQVIENNGDIKEAYLDIKDIEASSYIDDNGVTNFTSARQVPYVSLVKPKEIRSPLEEAAHVYAIEEVCKRTGFIEGSGQWRSKYNTAIATFLAGAAYASKAL